MPLQPPLKDAPRYPATLLVAVAAIGVSIYWWSGHPIDDLVLSSSTLATRPWTTLTSVLPHVNIVHLAFNLMWLWPLGTRLESAIGRVRYVGVLAVLGAISSAAEFALEDAGVGLSGVVYGLAALIWVLQPSVPALAGTMSRRSVQVLAVWFFVCIALTYTGVMPIGNVAHGSGALAGWLLGKAMAAPRGRRTGWLAAVLALALASGVGATVARPWVNFGTGTTMEAYRGTAALQAGKYDEAIVLLERAVKDRPRSVDMIVNLGLAYQHKDRHQEALDMYRRAVALEPKRKASLAPSVASILASEARDEYMHEHYDKAIALAGEALQWEPGNEYARDVMSHAKEEQAKAGTNSIAPPSPAKGDGNTGGP